MSYRKWREEFIGQYMKFVPRANMADAQAFLRDATSEQRWNEISCSIDIGEAETARREKASDRRMERVASRAKSLGLGLETNGDPRGNPFTLIVDGRQISVPGNGLPARCFR